MKRALVTGGNRGIGFAIAKGLKAAGLDVVIGARDPAEGAAVAKELAVGWIELDLRSPGSFDPALAPIWPVDVLVNNAGVLHRRDLLSHPEDFAEAMEVMVNGPFELISRLAPQMAASRYGRIVNLSSGWGSFTEGLGPNAYGIAKAALNAMTVALAKELPGNVKINAMCPGFVHTRMGGPSAPLTPDEGADTAIWLATLPEDGPTGGFFRRRKPIHF